MLKTQLHPAVLQEALDASANAAQKGLAQYFTPVEWARTLAKALPKFRPVVVDLTCGDGSLLAGARTRGTGRLLGCDLAPRSDSSFSILHSSFLQADLCQFYALLRAVKFEADCFVLNPPWDLHWYREPLADLARSELDAVRAAFAAHDGRTGRDTIDSTVATLCLALDRCTEQGEGFIIANNATLERLILNPGAPHRALETHCWYHLVIPGNICQSNSECRMQNAECPDSGNSSFFIHHSSFATGILYFARGHTQGLRHPAHHLRTADCPQSATPGNDTPAAPWDKARSSALLKTAETITEDLFANRLTLRKGPEARSYTVVEDLTWTQWQAAAEEWQRTRVDRDQSLVAARDWNLWLGPDGKIRTQLSLFDSHSGRVDKKQAAALHELGGKSPMALVVQRAQRRALEQAAFGGLYRVEPRLQETVRQCVIAYHQARTPLYPLPKIQRLGHLDEFDWIDCCQPLGEFLPGQGPGRGKIVSVNPATCEVEEMCIDGFYPITSQTLQVLRNGRKVNVEGGKDNVVWNGQELAIYITDRLGQQRLFMAEGLRDPSVKVHAEKPGCRKLIDACGATDLPVCAIDFTTRELCDHFVIPEVPDVAQRQPEQYQRNLQLLEQIEQLIA